MPPDDEPLPWKAIDVERQRLGPLRLPVTFGNLPRSPFRPNGGLIPIDAWRIGRLAWLRETLRQRPGLWEHDRLLPTDLPTSQEAVPDGDDSYKGAVQLERAASSSPRPRTARSAPKAAKATAGTADTNSEHAAHRQQERLPPASDRGARLVDMNQRLLKKYGTDHPR